MRPPGRHAILRGFCDRLTVFVLLIALTFILPRLMPGDPLELLISSDAARELSAGEIAHLRQTMGLDGSLLQQMGRNLHALAAGDLGFSFRHAAPVKALLLGALPWTLLLVGSALPLYLCTGLALGIEAGRQPGSFADRLLTAAMIVVASIPPFATAIILLIAFGIAWPILPISGSEPFFPAASFRARIGEIALHAIMPILVLALHELSRFFFVSRGEAVGISKRAFVTNARSRGVYGWRERINYFGRNMLPAALGRLGDSVTSMFGAVFFVEVVFSYPGIGKLIYDAFLERDYVLIQGAMIGLSALVLLINWFLDSAMASLAARG